MGRFRATIDLSKRRRSVNLAVSALDIARVLPHTTPDRTQLAAHNALLQCSAARRTYRGKRNVLEPDVGRKLRFISCDCKERLSVKIETFHFSFMWWRPGLPSDLRQIQACQSYHRTYNKVVTEILN